jgi:hypothetical protein
VHNKYQKEVNRFLKMYKNEKVSGNIRKNLFKKPLVGSKFSIRGTYAGLCSFGDKKTLYRCEVLFSIKADKG